MNSYVDLALLKGVGGLNISGTGENERMRKMVEAFSRNIDTYCGRPFFSQIETRVFSGNGRARLRLPGDLVAVTTLKEDADADATYEDTWASTDYELAPYDASPTAVIVLAEPYTHIEVNQRSTGTKNAFRWAQKAFELAGEWGYAKSTRTATETVNEAVDTSEVLIDVSANTDVQIGHTIIVDSEQMHVVDVAATATDITVRRAVNGTTAATHDTAAAILIVEYPSPVREAIIIEASRMWKMKDSAFASSVGIPDTGVVQVFGGQLQPRARSLLDPFRKINV